MAKRNFEEWFSTFRNSIATYSYYTDFSKVISNVEKVTIQLNLMNALLGTREKFDSTFRTLISKYPETLGCIPILVAVRNAKIPIQTELKKIILDFKTPNLPIEEYLAFFHKTGLADIIANHHVRSLVDYVFGVEVGLDSNGRKNRGGHLMEDLVENAIAKENLNYYAEMKLSHIEREYGLDLSSLSNNGQTEKRFDFVVHTDNHTYAIEANFYTSGGSKLNETARSYKTLALEAQTIKDFSFVWFTDGEGWKGARQNLLETFEVLPHMYNIADIENGIITKVFK